MEQSSIQPSPESLSQTNNKEVLQAEVVLPQRKRIKKWLMVLFFLFFLNVSGASAYFIYQKSQQKKVSSKPQSSVLPSSFPLPSPLTSNEPLVSPSTTSSTPSPLPSSPTITPEEVFKVADRYVCERLGQDFCQKYVKFNPLETTHSADGETYYLHYNVSIPEKQIFTTFQIKMNTDLVKTEDIQLLPDCKINTECDFAPRDEILAIAKLSANKFGGNVTADDLVLDFNNYGPKTPSRWIINYNIPQKNTPECELFRMGANVFLEINALTKEIIIEEKYCSAPGI